LIRRGALRRSVSLGAMGLAVAAGSALLVSGEALANCVTLGSATTCNTSAPNPFTSRVGNGGAMSVTVNSGAGINVTNGDGAIWNSSGAITNNGTIAASGGGTPAIRIETNLHTNNGTITGTGVVAIQRSAAAAGIASVSNSAGAVITATGVPNAIVDLGGGTFTINNRGTINGGVSMGPGIDNLNLYPGSVITGAIDGGSGGSIDALSLYGPGTGVVGTAVSGFETLSVNGGRWSFNNALTGVTSSSIQNGGTLVLNAPSSITGQMFIRPGGTLETSAANFPSSTLDNGGLVRFAEPAGSATFSRSISGPGAVEKTGPGTLTLSADNTFRGGLTVTGGVLAATRDAALGDAVSGMTLNGGAFRYLSGFALNPARAITMGSSGGTIDTNGFTTAIGGAIGGTGSLTKTGAGVLTLSGSNSYSGGTLVNAGTLAAGNNAALGAAGAGLTLDGGAFRYLSGFGLDRPVALGAGGGTIDTNGFSSTISGIVSGTGRLTKTGMGVLTLSGSNSYSGGTLVNAGTLAAASNTALGVPSSGLTLDGGAFRYLSGFGLDRPVSLGAGGGTLDTNGFDTGIAGAITGPGALTKAGDGTLTLTGSNSYGGGTTIAAGTLQLGNGGTSGAILGDVVNNGNLTFNRTDVVTFPGLISGTGSVTQRGSGTTILTADNSYSGGTTIERGTLQLGNGGTSGAITGDVVNKGSLVFNRSDALTFGGLVSGTGSLTQAGTGTTILTADNSYSGGTTIERGTLQLGDGGTSGSILGDVVNNGNLAFNRSDAVTFPGIISGTGSVTQRGSGTAILTGTNSYSGGTTIERGSLQLGDGGTSGSILGDVVNNGNLTFNRSDVVTFPGLISGTGSLTQAGSGTAVLTANNSYSGGTTIAAGTLQLGNGGTSGAILGDVVNNGNLTFNRSDVVTFGGLISGTGSVTQRGSGTTILTADNSYSGGTTIANGTLQLGNGGTSGSILGDVVNHGSLVFNRSDALTFGGLFSGTGSLTQAGTGTTILTADNSYSGGTRIVNGTLQLGDGGTSGSILGGVANEGTLVFNRSNLLDFAGLISGSGAVTQAGAGTTVLGAVQSYRGETRVQAGTLAIGRANGTPGGLAGGGALIVEAGGSFGGYGQVAGPATNRGAILVADALPIFAGGPLGTLAFASGLVNGGTVDLRGAVAGNRLRVAGDYAGTGGTLMINTVLAADNAPSDQLVVDGGRATGSTGLLVSNAGGEGALTVANGIRVIDAVNGAVTEAGAFSLAAPVLAGPYRYSLYRGAKDGSAADDWFLRSEDTRPKPPEPPEPGPDYREETSIYATLPGQALAYGRSLVGTFHERMGDSAQGLAPGGADDRLWGRVFGLAGSVEGQAGGKTTDNPDYDAALIGFEAGGDLYRAANAAGTRQAAGLSGGFGHMGADVRTQGGVDAGDTRMNVFSGGGYWTSLGAGGWYVDARALASLYDASASSFQNVQFDTLGAGLAGSLEACYPLALMPGLVAEPQLQAVAQGLWLGDGSDGHAGISFDDAASLATRAGLRLAYTQAGDDGLNVTLWARGDLWHDWLPPDVAVNFSSEDGPVDFHATGDDTWLAARLGVSALRSDRLQLHGSIGAERSLDGRTFAADARLGAVFSW